MINVNPSDKTHQTVAVFIPMTLCKINCDIKWMVVIVILYKTILILMRSHNYKAP